MKGGSVNMSKSTFKGSMSSVLPITLISKILRMPKLSREVELILDNCPPTFDFTEVDDKSVEDIDLCIMTMEKVNGIE
ncbi:MAG: hypothetical protein WBA22_08070 [Candidatus Methanofastidiosia archaeon]